jgi:hypothetical protein
VLQQRGADRVVPSGVYGMKTIQPIEENGKVKRKKNPRCR